MPPRSSLPFRRPVACRALLVYRAEPEVVQALLPEERRPLVVHDRALVILCYTRLGAIRRRWLPRRLGAPSDHLAVRIATERDGKGGVERGSWILSRRTSSWIEARCGDKLFRGDYARAEFTLEENNARLRLEVRGREREELFLLAETAPTLTGSLFGHAREAEELFATTEATRPHDVLAPEADELGLSSGAFAVEPLRPLEVRAACVDERALFPPGTIELDCVLRLVAQRRVKSPQRSAATSRGIIDSGGAAPAIPSA